MTRDPKWEDGRRNGVKWCITWLHQRADEMNDPHAKAILNTAAFHISVAARAVPANQSTGEGTKP